MDKQYSKKKIDKFKSFVRHEFMVFLALFLLILFMWFSDYSPLNYNQSPNSIHAQNPTKSCLGRYIYMHDLPPKFNSKLLENCESLNKWYDMCPYLQNAGFGAEIVENMKGIIFGQKGWYSTDEFLLEVIFHNRMKKYDCLTSDSSLASAVYVPFYPGLDLSRHLWDHNTTVRDSLSIDLAGWLVDKPEWRKMYGGDHFVVAGRIAWEFRRHPDQNGWGGSLMNLPEFKNLTMLTIEATFLSNEIAIPYPTNFHPRALNQITEWQNRMRTRKRNYLFAFVGGPRPSREDLVRGEIISHCLEMEKDCKLLDCHKGSKCHNPVDLMEVFVDSVFCLQPPGDSFTRRSTFDSIIAGCIPVFFHPGSAYAQYVWHLPKNHSEYSVFIPENLVKNGSLSIKEMLLKVSDEERRALREEVITLIPNIIYLNPLVDSMEMEKVEDAFDITVKRVIERVGKLKNNSSTNRGSWKHKLSLLGLHQWNSYF